MRYLFFTLLSVICVFHQSWGAQEKGLSINPQLLTGAWTAHWICTPNSDSHNYSVQHFRKEIELEAVPDAFVVHASADNRYQLFVNGERVSWGPARGQPDHWYFETVDLAPYLHPGLNTLAAVIWNFGDEAPMAQETWRTGFLLQGDTEAEWAVNTDDSWVAMENQAYQPLLFSHGEMRGYFVVGPADQVDGNKYPWGWKTSAFDDHDWQPATALDLASARGANDSHSRWMLIPRDIPMMEQFNQRFASVREISGAVIPESFPSKTGAIEIPAGSKVRILLDQSHLTTAYPKILVSGGKGAKIQMGYAEALYAPEGARGNKGDRNVIEGKEFIGYHDVFFPDGGDQREFRPLWWRTFRYVELQIETTDTPLTIENLSSEFTAYPFEMNAEFEAGDPFFDQLLEVGWRTARLCSHETYMDCPYYEQLQYGGDTRIQILVSYFNSGDARLGRKAIKQINNSRTAEGLTFSRAPSRLPQYIPGYSLWWIGMLHDHYYYANDPVFIQSMLSGMESVLSYFESETQANGSLKKLPWWNYVDWTTWKGGVGPSGKSGSSAPQDFQLLLAYEWAAELESELGRQTMANHYQTLHSQLKETILELYWDDSRGFFSDTPEHSEHYSQHSNALAIISGVIEGEAAGAVMEKVLNDDSLTQCSYYFTHYLHEALLKTGKGDLFLEMLDPWKEMLAKNLTTWAERPDWASNPTRSDCHAWSSVPNYELFRTVLGIRSASPGFETVMIQPNLGHLDHASGSMPHPAGQIDVELKRSGDGDVVAKIRLPETVTGTFEWNDKNYTLSGGINEMKTGK